ncbi:RNA-binding protein 27, partial [Clonorchis sinensis]
FEQLGSIPSLVLPSGAMAAMHRKGATAERFFKEQRGVRRGEKGHKEIAQRENMVASSVWLPRRLRHGYTRDWTRCQPSTLLSPLDRAAIVKVSDCQSCEAQTLLKQSWVRRMWKNYCNNNKKPLNPFWQDSRLSGLRDLRGPSYPLPSGIDFLASIMDSDLDYIQWSFGRIGEVGQTTLKTANIAPFTFCHPGFSASNIVRIPILDRHFNQFEFPIPTVHYVLPSIIIIIIKTVAAGTNLPMSSRNPRLQVWCVADPIPLSQYVIALIKKDKPEKELKEICIDQLEVFLQENTSSFVSDLFAALKSRSYIASEAAVTHAHAQSSNDSSAATKRTPACEHSRADVSKDKKRHTPGDSVVTGTDSLSSAPKQRRKRSNSNRPKSATSSKSRSRSPQSAGRNAISSTAGHSRTGRKSEDKEGASDDGRTRPADLDTHFSRRDNDHTGRRGAAFSSSGRGDPSWYRRRSKSRELDARRSRLSRERFRSPDNDRYGGRLRNAQGDRDVVGRGSEFSRRRRCRNFDDRGFCAFGSHCPFDHGPEALVLPSTRAAAAAITQMSTQATYANSNILSLPDSSTSSEQQLPLTEQQVSSHPQVVQLQSVVSAVIPAGGSGLDQGVNAASNFHSNERTAVPVYRPTPIKQSTSSTIECIDSTDIPINLALMSVPPPTPDGYAWNVAGFDLSAYAQAAPLAECYRNSIGSVAVRPNIIPIPLATSATGATGSAVTTCHAPPAYEPDKPHISMISNTESSVSPSVEVWAAGRETGSRPSVTYTPSPISERLSKPTFSSTFPSSTARDSSFPCVLYITHIPWRLNDDFKLREHFSRFGTLVRVVSRYYSIPDAALVEFSSTDEAERAYRSPEPILSNRFIRLSTMPPNKFGQSRRGRQTPYDLRSKTLKERLGQRPIASQDKYGWLRSAIDTPGPTDPAPQKGGRSRWRLERNGNGLLDDMASGEEEVEDQRMAVDDENSGRPGLVDYAIDRSLDGSLKSNVDLSDQVRYQLLNCLPILRLSSSQNRVDGGKSRYSLSRTNKSEAASYLWERQKALALKQRAELMKQLDKSRETKQTLLEAQRAYILRLRNQLKKVMSKLEGQAELGDVGDATSTSDRRQLLSEAKRIQTDLATALANEKKVLASMSSTKEGDSVDPMYVGSTTISAAALQALPEPVATERRKQIAEVRSSLKLVEEDMAVLKAKGEPVSDQRRRILELKRQMQSLLKQQQQQFELAQLKLIETLTEKLSLQKPLSQTIEPSGSVIDTTLNAIPEFQFDPISCITFDSWFSKHEDFFRLDLGNREDSWKARQLLNYLYTQQVVKHNYSSADQPVLEVTFCTRDFAERAMRQFHQFRGRSVHMSFAPPPTEGPAATTISESVTSSVQVRSGTGYQTEQWHRLHLRVMFPPIANIIWPEGLSDIPYDVVLVFEEKKVQVYFDAFGTHKVSSSRAIVTMQHRTNGLATRTPHITSYLQIANVRSVATRYRTVLPRLSLLESFTITISRYRGARLRTINYAMSEIRSLLSLYNYWIVQS